MHSRFYLSHFVWVARILKHSFKNGSIIERSRRAASIHTTQNDTRSEDVKKRKKIQCAVIFLWWIGRASDAHTNRTMLRNRHGASFKFRAHNQWLDLYHAINYLLFSMFYLFITFHLNFDLAADCRETKSNNSLHCFHSSRFLPVISSCAISADVSRYLFVGGFACMCWLCADHFSLRDYPCTWAPVVFFLILCTKHTHDHFACTHAFSQMRHTNTYAPTHTPNRCLCAVGA